MASVVVTIKIMPISPSIDLEKIENEANKKIDEFTNLKDRKSEIEPIAFGLKALKMTFVMDEKKGSPDPVTEKIMKIKGIQSCEVIDVRRAVG